MQNKPKCFFCQNVLKADAVTINKGVSPYYSLAKGQPINVNILPDEILLKVRCPKCGAHGEALGDYASFKGSFQHSKRTMIEIPNVVVQRLTKDNAIIDFRNLHYINNFNPSRRTN
jgi:hypothetical protein